MGCLTDELLGGARPRESAELVVRAVALGPGSMYHQDDEFFRLNEVPVDENNETVKLLYKVRAVADLLRGETRTLTPREVRSVVFGA
jgi:hypothetical protein